MVFQTLAARILTRHYFLRRYSLSPKLEDDSRYEKALHTSSCCRRRVDEGLTLVDLHASQAHNEHSAHLILLRIALATPGALVGFYFVLSFTKNRALSGACKKIVTQHFYTRSFCQLFEVVKTCIPPFITQLWKAFFFLLSIFFLHSAYIFQLDPDSRSSLVETVASKPNAPFSLSFPSWEAPARVARQPIVFGLPTRVPLLLVILLVPDSSHSETWNKLVVQYSGGTGLCRTVGHVRSVTSTSFTFCCHNLLYFLLFLLKFC